MQMEKLDELSSGMKAGRRCAVAILRYSSRQQTSCARRLNGFRRSFHKVHPDYGRMLLSDYWELM